MIIEVMLDGRGAVRVETETVASLRQIKGLVDHATQTLTNATEAKPKAREGYGFGAGDSVLLDRNVRQDGDPYEFGQVFR